MNEVINHNSERNKRVDELEATLLHNLPAIKPGLQHTFKDGVYEREMTVPAHPDGVFITSRIHKTEHPFKLKKGKISIWDELGRETVLEAPFMGMTKPGTRRVAYIWPNEELVWTTYHETKVLPENDSDEAIEAAVELIGSEILEPHENYVLEGEVKSNTVNKKYTPCLIE